MPAFEQNRSIAPCRAIVCATSRRTSASRETSAAIAVAADLVGHLRCRGGVVDVGDDDRLRALRGEPPAQRAADAVAAAGDDDDFVGNLHRQDVNAELQRSQRIWLCDSAPLRSTDSVTRS